MDRYIRYATNSTSHLHCGSIADPVNQLTMEDPLIDIPNGRNQPFALIITADEVTDRKIREVLLAGGDLTDTQIITQKLPPSGVMKYGLHDDADVFVMGMSRSAFVKDQVGRSPRRRSTLFACYRSTIPPTICATFLSSSGMARSKHAVDLIFSLLIFV
jgi:hypothetical protein